MKTNPFVLACTFMLGCLVSLMAINTFAHPANAQSSSDSSNDTQKGDALGDLKAVAVQAESNKEILAVFRRIENSALTKGPGIAMAVYEFVSKGNGKIDVYLSGTRHIDFDLMHPDLDNGKGAKIPPSEMKKAIEEYQEAQRKKEEKNAKK